MLKRALAYRVGSILIGFGMNLAIFGSITFSLFLTVLFTVVLTSYYMIFHRLWPDE